MADFRKPKYSGSLNLAPECGPVLIELDTEAKTATASLEDPQSQYTLAGGGGGSLQYVVPEQTTTVVYDETLQKYIAVVENVNILGLNDDQALFAKLTFPVLGEVVCPATFTENTIELSVPGGMTIKKESGDFGRWYIEFSAEVLGAEYPIAIIKSF